MNMRVSFYNKDGNLEIWDCDKIEVDDKNFDYAKEEGFINIKLMLPK